jgi:hypothetical protein
MRKDSGFHVRVERELRQAFVDTCKSRDEAAGQVLRQFMREYVDQHRRGAQGELFREPER